MRTESKLILYLDCLVEVSQERVQPKDRIYKKFDSRLFFCHEKHKGPM